MKARNIKHRLSDVLDNWLSTIDDEAFAKRIRQNCLVTGGSIVSLLLDERVSDYDVYFKTKEITKEVAEYYVQRFLNENNNITVDLKVEDDNGRIRITAKSVGIVSEDGTEDYEYFEFLDDAQNIRTDQYINKAFGLNEEREEDEKPPFRPKFMSSNAISLANKVQLIVRFYGEAKEIHENYDFVHCTCYYDPKTNHLELPKAALESILTKELRYVGSLYPLCSVIRTRKFIKRGWMITAGQYLKMIMQLNQLDLFNLHILEDQLIGVDVAYFGEVIEKLKDKDPEKVNTAYLMEIIDRIF